MMFYRAMAIGVLVAGIVGCATNTGLPQTRDAFVRMYKDGGLFRNAEHHAINRSKTAVVSDLNQFVNKCLHVKVTSTLRQGYSVDRSTTTYHPKMTETKSGATSLSVQETYRDKPEKGHPPGGMYTLVAEMRAQGGKTKLDIYHAGRTPIANSIKDWANGDKASCPKF